MVENKPSPSTERHYTPIEIAKIMGLSRTTVYTLLENEPGVFKLGNRGLNRTRLTLRVPESVWERIHEKYTVKAEDSYQKPHLRALRNDR